jgi:hypothetical protein
MEKRPLQDESIFMPYMEKLYSRTILGRTGDQREESVKYTQALSARMKFESQAEWLARVQEYAQACEEFNEELSREEIDKATAFSIYPASIFPPAVVVPLKAGQTLVRTLFGPSEDVCWSCLDEFTLENLWAVDWHFELDVKTDVILMNCNWWYVDEDWKAIVNRRHMRTGEKFRELCIQRPFLEGATMVTDILRDLRNELMPDHSDSLLFYHGYVGNSTVDALYGSRSIFELIHLMSAYACTKIGFPYQTYGSYLPIPTMYAMMLQLPPKTIPQRLFGIFGGSFWLSNYTLSHLETLLETFGEEFVPPAPQESFLSSIRYGMDYIRYPPSFKQSRYVYGQEAQMRPPTDYILPQKEIARVDSASKQVESARNEHPEWFV